MVLLVVWTVEVGSLAPDALLILPKVYHCARHAGGVVDSVGDADAFAIIACKEEARGVGFDASDALKNALITDFVLWNRLGPVLMAHHQGVSIN